MMFACLIAPGAAASKCAEAFSPSYEEVDGNTVIIDISGLHRLYGPPLEVAEALRVAAHHAEARVGVAAHREAAIHAARGFRGVTVLPPGEEAGRLGGLAVELLDPSPELLATLDCWASGRFATWPSYRKSGSPSGWVRKGSGCKSWRDASR